MKLSEQMEKALNAYSKTNERLLILRRINNYDQSYIAKTINIDQTTYSKIENNIIKPQIKILIKLSILYKVDINCLIGNEDSDKEKEIAELKKTIEQMEIKNKRIADLEKTIKEMESKAKDQEAIIKNIGKIISK